MSKKLIYILSIIVLLFLSGFLFFNFINQKVQTTQKTESVITLSADNLSKEIILIEDLKRFDHFIEKAIQIKGIIKKIESNGNGYTVVLNSENKKINILCKLQVDQNEKIGDLIIGDTITIKGIYKGYLIDMILLNCIITKH